MRELDLDVLLREKREEPTTVSISAVDSWLKGGVVFVGLFATLKWLFTKKMWLMFTSISSISIVTIMAIVQMDSTSSTSSKLTDDAPKQNKMVNREVRSKKRAVTENKVNPIVEKGFMTEMYNMSFLVPDQLYSEQEHNSIELLDFNKPTLGVDNESKDHFSRIDANGFVHFTLVNGKSCSVQNTIPSEDGIAPLNYSIKNGTLYLNSSNENNASDLIITVTDLDKIKLNGFCEMVTNSTFQSADLELDVNGFTKLSIDLNVNDLEIDMNGETKGKLNVKSKIFDFESNGFSDVEIESDFEHSRIETNGFSKIKFIGTSITTIMEVTGESKLSVEEFASQELFLKVSGENDKIETNVSSKLDVEISGKNTVIIVGSPEILNQQVTEGCKLKIK